MSNSEKDLNSVRSFVKYPARRGPIRNSLQNRQSVVRQDSSPAISCRIESNFSENGKRKQRSQPESEGAEEKENTCSAGIGRILELNLQTDQDLVDENDDGFKTPTSSDQKIPAIAKCPPPPRKQKPPGSMKRRAPRRRVLLDLTNEIELLFPPAILADLGNNIKKIRQPN